MPEERFPSRPVPAHLSAVSAHPADIDAAVASRNWNRRFAPELEQAFEEHTRGYRARVVRSMILPSVLVYNAFLLVDFLLVPNTFLLAAALHFAVVTPWILFVGFVIGMKPRLVVRESLAASIPFLMGVQIMVVYTLNTGEGADQYQYLAIMILVFMNSVQRPDNRFAIGTSALLAAVYFGALLSGHSPFAVKLIGTTSMAAAAYLTLSANRRMERDARHAFLRSLQDQYRREEAERAADRDVLTGLANRRRLDREIAERWEGLARSGACVAVVMIDVDHFKPFNDRYGHLVGDICLKRVADAIGAGLRGEDALAVRFGGEEFLVLLWDADLSHAARTAERIRSAMEASAIPNEAAGQRGVVTLSLGVSAGAASAGHAPDIIAGADGALYAAKRDGRNQVRVALPAETLGSPAPDNRERASAL